MCDTPSPHPLHVFRYIPSKVVMVPTDRYVLPIIHGNLRRTLRGSGWIKISAKKPPPTTFFFCFLLRMPISSCGDRKLFVRFRFKDYDDYFRDYRKEKRLPIEMRFYEAQFRGKNSIIYHFFSLVADWELFLGFDRKLRHWYWIIRGKLDGISVRFVFGYVEKNVMYLSWHETRNQSIDVGDTISRDKQIRGVVSPQDSSQLSVQFLFFGIKGIKGRLVTRISRPFSLPPLRTFFRCESVTPSLLFLSALTPCQETSRKKKKRKLSTPSLHSFDLTCRGDSKKYGAW